MRRARLLLPGTFLAVLALALACVARQAGGADTLTLRNGATHEGRFAAYKNGRFHFAASDGTELREMRVRVETLTLAPPAKVTMKQRGKKEVEDVLFKQYRQPEFVFLQGGQEFVITGPHMTAIDVGLDFNRTVHTGPGQAVAGDDAEFDLAGLIKPGPVTVVHFHMATVVSSVRQGNYLAHRAANSKGKIEMVKVELKDWNEPVALKYAITSAPQFWIYDRQGKLRTKLVHRFTAQDIDSALKSAGQ